MRRIFAFTALVLWLSAVNAITPHISVRDKGKQAKTTLPVHPWAGHRIGFIGDSVTDPNLYGNDVKKYWQYLAEWLGIKPCVQAVSGHQWSHAPALIDRLYQAEGDSMDAIFVFLGTNEFNAAVPLGQWFDEKKEKVMRAVGEEKHLQERMHRTLSSDPNTLRGRINIALQKLKSLYPTRQIVLLTPLHRGFAEFGSRNVQPDENYQNELGLYVDAYVQAIKEASNVWSVPVIDLNAVSGLNPMVEEQRCYFWSTEHDCLHPNSLGHERIARVLMAEMWRLPLF